MGLNINRKIFQILITLLRTIRATQTRFSYPERQKT